MQMADLTRDDVLKLAQLARLQLTDQEVQEFSGELTAILHYVEQLQNVDVSGLKPTNQVNGLINVMREDTEVDYGYAPHELLNNVPKTQDNQIRSQRMVG